MRSVRKTMLGSGARGRRGNAWGALFGELGWYGYVAMLVFTVPLVVGLVYEWMKGALEW